MKKAINFTARWIILILFATNASGQDNKKITKPESLSNGDDNQGDVYQKLREYSNPGKYHQLLQKLVGKWILNGKAFSGDPDSNKIVFRFKSKAERKAFADGRYFIVSIIGDKIEMPTQKGITKKVNAQEIITEGYDNVKKKYLQVTISNHIGSDILYTEGSYDSLSKTIAFDFLQELVPGIKDEIRELFRMIDNDHYIIEYYQKRGDQYIKSTEIEYAREKNK